MTPFRLDNFQAQRISVDEAYEKCIDKKKFRPFLDRVPEPWEE